MFDRYQQDFARARSAIAGHVMSERQSRSFDFRTPGKGSSYAYSLTWSPGSVTLAGDLGEMTVTHWQALWTFKEGMAWLAGSEWDYLLGKAGTKADVIDVEGTVNDILHMAWEGRDFGGDLLARLKKRFRLERAWGNGLWFALRRELTAELDGCGPERLGEFTAWDLGIDDYYGAYRRHPHDLAQITALQRAAAMILAEVFPYEWVRG